MAKTLSAKCLAYAEQWKAGADRELATAHVLRAVGKDWPNVYWHAGFAVEHILKAIRVKLHDLEQWPNSDKGASWHQLEFILRRCGLAASVADAASHDSSFGAYWLTVKDWDQQKRYPENTPTETEARDLLTAVANPTSGVMKWLLQTYHSI
jgi:hypothetical protein